MIKKYLLLRGSEDLESLNFVIVGEPEQPSDFAGWSVYMTTCPVTSSYKGELSAVM